MKLSIADAAKEANVTRQHLYKLRDAGKLTLETDAKGKQVVDTAELYRVFPVDNRHQYQAPPVNNPLESENRLLKDQLHEYRERERRHLDTIERLTTLLDHRPSEPAPLPDQVREEPAAPPAKKGFIARLFGR